MNMTNFRTELRTKSAGFLTHGGVFYKQQQVLLISVFSSAAKLRTFNSLSLERL